MPVLQISDRRLRHNPLSGHRADIRQLFNETCPI